MQYALFHDREAISMSNEATVYHDAAMIWTNSATPVKNAYVAFRLVIELDAVCDDPVEIAVSASSQYRLYLNGVYLGRGPAREWSGHLGLDRYALGERLVSGRNVLSALVHYYGEEVGGYPPALPGLLVCGAIGGRSLSTGVAEWQVCRLDGWNAYSGRSSIYVGFNEDLRMDGYMPAVWERGDGAGWDTARVLPEAVQQWPRYEPRSIPPLQERDIVPVNVPAIGEVAWPEGALVHSQCIAEEVHRPIAAARVQRAHALFPLTIAAGEPVYLIVDVGMLTSGAARFTIRAQGGEELFIGYADRLRLPDRLFSEGRDALDADPRHNLSLHADCTHGGVNDAVDHFVLRAGVNSWEAPFNLHGFRYLELCLFNIHGDITIEQVAAREITYAVAPRGQFRCSDPAWNRIWEDGERTARLCMLDTFMDNPTRERQQYADDGRLQALYAYAYFGDTQLARRLIRLTAQGLRDDGALQAGGPWCWNQVMSAWTLHWLEALREYVEHTGDMAPALEVADTMATALEWYRQWQAPDGLLTIEERFGWCGAPGGVIWNFLDWQGIDGEVKGDAARWTINAIYHQALGTAAGFMAALGRTVAAEHYRSLREALGTAMRAAFGSAEAPGSTSEHALAYLTLAGIISGQMGTVAAAVETGAFHTDMLYLHFTLDALLREGYDEAVISALRQTLGVMSIEGTGTVYETRSARLNPQHALCQGVGALAGYFLPRVLAGVRPDYVRKEVLLSPHPLDLRWISTTVPVPGGEIHAELTREGDALRVMIEAPDGWQVKAEGERQKAEGRRQKAEDRRMKDEG